MKIGETTAVESLKIHQNKDTVIDVKTLDLRQIWENGLVEAWK